MRKIFNETKLPVQTISRALVYPIGNTLWSSPIFTDTIYSGKRSATFLGIKTISV